MCRILTRCRVAGILALLAAALTACLGAPDLPPVPDPATPAPTFAVSGTVTRGPYLQDVTEGAATVVWRTDTPSVGGVAIHAAAGGGAGSVQHEPAAGADHVVRVAGLAPNTAYRYTVLAGDQALNGEVEFHTAPTPGAADPVTFAVWGDSGCGCPEQFAVAAQMAAAAPTLLIHTGDLIYEDGQAAGFDPRFFAPYRATLAAAPVYPALGNHDVITDKGAPWLHAFFLPGDPGDHSTRYYAFTWGNAHFFALDSEEDFGPTSDQYNWLLADLQSPAAQHATWRFVFFHRPPYSSGYGHGSSYDLREAWSPLFERFGVDIVFNGHEHNYERTTPRRDFAAVGGTHAVIYVVSGGGGKDLYNVGHQSWTAASSMLNHFVRVRLAGPQLQLDAIDDKGQVFDHLELTQAAP